MSLACRYDRLAVDYAHLHGIVLTDPVEACSQPPTHRVHVDVKNQDGYEVDIQAHLCAAHEVQAQQSAGHLGSYRLRQPATT